MKKKIIALLIISMVIFTQTACGDKNNEYENDIDPASLAGYLTENITFRDELEKVDEDIVSGIYRMDDEESIDFCVYMSSGATAEEVAVAAVCDSEEEKKAIGIIESRINDQKKSFEDYVPEEMPKLEKALIKSENGIVVCIVCDDPEEGEKVLNDYMSKNH